jgi:streptogramin lyase
MRRPLQAALLGLALAISGAVPAPAALTPTITAYPSSNPISPSSHPYGIAAGAGGALWFTDPYGHDIGRMTVGGALTLQAPVPATAFQYGIAAGSDGAMWFVSQSPSSVSRIDGTGSVLTKNLASPTANPTHIVAGPEGALWFTEGVTKAIGRIPATTPLAEPDESRTTSEGPNAIASGPDGNLWFTEYSASAIGRMSPAGVTTYVPLPPGIENPEGIAAGPDGALWYTALNPPTIVRIATNGIQHPYPLPAKLFPGEIAAGPDGALWFAGGDVIGRLSTDGAVETFPLPAGVGLNDITAGPDGNLWFTEENAGQIGRITTPPNATTGSIGEVRATGATAAGTVNGHSQPTDIAIEYGPQGGATTTTPADHPPVGAMDQPVSIALSGLAPSTAYRYRVVATNPTGTATGAFEAFTTGPAPSCRVTRAGHKHGGTIRLALSCKATRAIAARATIRVPAATSKRTQATRQPHPRSLLFGTAHARVVNGKAALLIKPSKAARAQLASRHRLSVKIALNLHGGGTSTSMRKTVRIK